MHVFNMRHSRLGTPTNLLSLLHNYPGLLKTPVFRIIILCVVIYTMDDYDITGELRNDEQRTTCYMSVYKLTYNTVTSPSVFPVCVPLKKYS